MGNKKKKQQKSEAQKQQRKYDRGQIFVKVIAAILAVFILIAGAASSIYMLMSL